MTRSHLNQEPVAAWAARPGETRVSAAYLRARAQELLGGGDIDAYRSLFGHAAELEDPDRRFHAQVVLLEQGLVAAAPRGCRPADAALMAVADAAVELIEEQPNEPLVLNCAATALHELGSVDAAGALFGAVHRLDPTLPGLEQKLAAGRDHRLGRATALSGHGGLASLSRRAILAAGNARPAAGLTLSLCMIVRDEEEMLPRCLEAIAPVVDEIIVVDTGSRDATAEIARSFGARVIEHEWVDSFAAARNVSFDAATGDWLMFVDADQVLVSDDADQLRALTGHTWREAFYLVETSYLGESDDGYAARDNVLRVFRNRPRYRFEGRVHEQITHTLPMYAPGRIHQTAIRIRHYGYLEGVRSARAKSQRNIALLRKQAQEGSSDAFLHFNLGAEYAADGDTAAALNEFERAWSMVVALGAGVDYRYAPPLIARLVEAMRHSGRLGDAAAVAAEGLRRYPEFTDLVFAQARIAFEAGAVDEARERYRRCIAMGDAPARYRPIVGSGTYLPRIALAQLALGEGEDEVARELLGWCLEHHPSLPGVVDSYLSLRLRAGLPAQEAVAEIERIVASVTPSMRLIFGSTLQDAGALEAATAQYVSGTPGPGRDAAAARGQPWCGHRDIVGVKGRHVHSCGVTHRGLCAHFGREDGRRLRRIREGTSRPLRERARRVRRLAGERIWPSATCPPGRDDRRDGAAANPGDPAEGSSLCAVRAPAAGPRAIRFPAPSTA
jgi:glycosyltransferase involved in cell wall biosynthesis